MLCEDPKTRGAVADAGGVSALITLCEASTQRDICLKLRSMLWRSAARAAWRRTESSSDTAVTAMCDRVAVAYSP